MAVRYRSRAYTGEILERSSSNSFLSVPANDDNNNGNAEEYLGRFTFKSRATAERLVAWMLDRFNKDPLRARKQSLKLK